MYLVASIWYPAWIMSNLIHIHTLWLPEKIGDDERGRLIQILSKPEQEELAKISHPTSNMEYLLGHAMLRIKMTEALGAEPHELPLKFGRKQKPVWETQTCGSAEVRKCGSEDTRSSARPNIRTSEQQYYLSLSHSHGLVATAFANVPIGIDVEKIRTQSHGRQVAEKQFHPLEQAVLMRDEGSDFDHKFFAYWSLKEALFKAGDFNQADVAKRTEFVFNAAGIKCNFHFAASPNLRSSWHFSLHPFPNNFLMAVAIHSDDKFEIVQHEVTPAELFQATLAMSPHQISRK